MSGEARVWYEHVRTGDRGYIVRKGERDVIVLDRPSDPMPERSFNAGDWRPCKEHRPVSAVQVGRICFEADRQLCVAIGLHVQAKREWLNLTDEARIAWMRDGPTHPVRRRLYVAMRDALTPADESEES